MEAAFEMAGYFAAHAVWCVSDGETLIPMFVVEDAEGERHLTRVEDHELTDAVRAAREQFESSEGVPYAAVLYDGYLTLRGERLDAIFVEVADHGSGARASLAIPYRHAAQPDGFAVFRPKFLALPESADAKALGTSLFRGVAQHEKGAAVWTRCLDESR